MCSSCIVLAHSNSNGRFANQFFRAMAAHFISKNLNISALYPFDMKPFLGIDLHNKEITQQRHIDVPNIHEIQLTDTNFMKYATECICLNENTILNINNIFCQTKEFALKIHEFINIENNKIAIISNNKYNSLHKNNNHVFVHVRLGDVIHLNPGLTYYKNVLASIEFDGGYITSDSINHPICKELMYKFKLIPINLNETETIHFGSMCKHIVLSNGTFSWLIGLLSFGSNVYWPEIKQIWHGDIYGCMPNWNKVCY
jgi:hypothetical protein